MALNKNGPGSRMQTATWLESSFAGLGAARGWRWSDPFVASARARMLTLIAKFDAGSKTIKQKVRLARAAFTIMLRSIFGSRRMNLFLKKKL